ncbi:MAG: hypothetical protein AAF830_02745 [Pseudomonadota bacterium]
MENLNHGAAFNDPRWQAIASASIDDPHAVFPLSVRLARDNAWAPAFAERVVEEYRHFCYLAMTAGHEVTPSDEVDQAWHLHLLYTEHYWGTWTEALGAPLHHGPTKGGQAEGDRYWANYNATMASYERAFGEKPPSDIWPPAEERFDTPGAMQRVDTSRVLMIDRGAASKALTMTGAMCLGFALMLATAPAPTDTLQAGFASAVDALTTKDKIIIGFGVFGVVLIIAGLSSAIRGKRRSRRGDGASAAFGCGTAGGKSSDADGGGDGGTSGCSGCGGCGGG